MTFENDAKLFVKGFTQQAKYEVLAKEPSGFEGEFIAVLTDMVTTSGILIIAATLTEDDKWVLDCSNGEILTLEKEPKVERKMDYGKLVENFSRDFLMRATFDVVLPDKFKKVEEEIENGSKDYRLVGYIGENEIVTSHLKKFWTDSKGKRHALTLSGSHYVF